MSTKYLPTELKKENKNVFEIFNLNKYKGPNNINSPR